MKPRTTQTTHFEPSEAEIQKCAYFLWKEEGSPSGRDLDIWLRARELVRHHAATHRPPPERQRVAAR